MAAATGIVSHSGMNVPFTESFIIGMATSWDKFDTLFQYS